MEVLFFFITHFALSKFASLDKPNTFAKGTVEKLSFPRYARATKNSLLFSFEKINKQAQTNTDYYHCCSYAYDFNSWDRRKLGLLGR